MPNRSVIHASQLAVGRYARRFLKVSKFIFVNEAARSSRPVKVEDAGGGMASIVVNEMLPRSVAYNVARILSENTQRG